MSLPIHRPSHERPLRLQPRAVARRLQQFHQLLIRSLRKVRHLRRDVALRRDAHDVAVVRAGPAEGRGAFPARHVGIAARVHVNVRRARHLHERLRRRRLLECRAFRAHRVTEDGAAAPVARVGQIIPRGGPAGLVNPACAAAGTAAVVGERRDEFVGEIFVEPRIAVILEAGEMVEANVPSAAVVRVVAREDVAQRRDGRLEDVARAARVELEIAAVWPHADDAAAAELEFAPVRALGLHEAEVAAGDVEPAVNAQLHAVRRVIGGAVLESERDVFHEHLLLVGDAVAVLVNERAEVRRVDAIDRAAVHHEAARRIHVLHEFLHLVRAPVAIRVAQADDAPSVRLPAERSVAVARHVERAVRRGGDEHRVVRRLRSCEERRLESLRRFRVLQNLRLILRRELHNRRRDVAFLAERIIRARRCLSVLLARLRIRRNGHRHRLRFRIEFRVNGLDARPFHRDFADARPAARRRSRAGDFHKAHVLRGERVLAVAGLFSASCIGKDAPRFPVGAALDLVLVGAVRALPRDLDSREFLRLLKLQLQPLRKARSRGAPARAFVAIHRAPREIILAALLAARGDRDERSTRWRGLEFGCRRRLRRRALRRVGLCGSGLRCGLDESDLVLAGERLEVFRVQLVARPQQPAGDEIEIARIGDGLVVVADRRAEDARLVRAVFIRPSDHGFHRTFAVLRLLRLRADRERLAAVHLHVVVEFLVDGRPVRQALRDRMRRVGEMNRDRLLPVVRARLQAEIFEPVIRPRAVAVHRAVEVHRGHRLVRLDDVLHERQILHARRALVVDDRVVALRPAGLVVERKMRRGPAVVRPDHIHLHIRARLDSLAQDLLLRRIIMATPTRDQQDVQRFRFRLGKVGGEERDERGSEFAKHALENVRRVE